MTRLIAATVMGGKVYPHELLLYGKWNAERVVRLSEAQVEKIIQPFAKDRIVRSETELLEVLHGSSAPNTAADKVWIPENLEPLVAALWEDQCRTS